MLRKSIMVLFVALLLVTFSYNLAFAEVTMLNLQSDAEWERVGYEALSEISEAEIGIGLDLNIFADTSTYQTQTRLALPTSRAPDLFKWWFGYRMRDLVEEGLIADVTHVWEKYIEAGEYPESLINSFGMDGRAYALPSSVSYYPVFYNTKVFENLGLEAPETWDEFLAISETIKESGIHPIAVPTVGWRSLLWFQEILIRTDPSVYEQLMKGEIAYDSQEVLDAMLIVKDLIDKGYFSPPGMSDEMTDRLFMNGEAAMHLIGDWWGGIRKQDGFEDFDVFVLPGVTEKGQSSMIIEGMPLLIGANAEQKEEAIEFAEFFMSAEAQEVYSPALNRNPVNVTVSDEFRPEYLQQLTADIEADKYELYTRYWEATPPQIVEPVVELLERFLIHPEQYESIFEDAEKIAQEHWDEVNN